MQTYLPDYLVICVYQAQITVDIIAGAIVIFKEHELLQLSYLYYEFQ